MKLVYVFYLHQVPQPTPLDCRPPAFQSSPFTDRKSAFRKAFPASVRRTECGPSSGSSGTSCAVIRARTSARTPSSSAWRPVSLNASSPVDPSTTTPNQRTALSPKWTATPSPQVPAPKRPRGHSCPPPTARRTISNPTAS